MNLENKKCVPCQVGGLPLTPAEVAIFMNGLSGWTDEAGVKIVRKFEFKDFKQSMAFVNMVAEIAESEGHHPDIHIYYNKVTIELHTHEAKGLTENDFIVAAKINKIDISSLTR